MIAVEKQTWVIDAKWSLWNAKPLPEAQSSLTSRMKLQALYWQLLLGWTCKYTPEVKVYSTQEELEELSYVCTNIPPK